LNLFQDLESKIHGRQAEMAVVGLGYVGLPLALEFAEAGFRVQGIDVDVRRVEDLGAGRSYVADMHDDRVRTQIDAGRLVATTSYADVGRCDCINVCVPTPLRRTRDPDVSHIVAAVEEMRKHLRPGQLVILGSTTYPGTTHELYRTMLEESGLTIGQDVCLAFAPERIDPANTEFAFRDVPKIVGGETELCTHLAAELFETIFERVIRMSNSQAAEMVKLLENTFRMINIGLVNEVAMMCDKLGLDVWEVIEAAATKPYGFMKFVPGPGLGGHCIPVDPNYLSWKLRSLNFSARFIEIATEINSGMPAWVVERAARILNRQKLSVNGSQILLLGMAYKADVADTRESPAIDIFLSLDQQGAHVRYHARVQVGRADRCCARADRSRHHHHGTPERGLRKAVCAMPKRPRHPERYRSARPAEGRGASLSDF
jgi:UDP-N-acetyl-D-glucosamine dehydrogenase